MPAVNPHQPDSYKIPIRHLNGTAAAMNFWDAIYYLAAVNGRIVPGGDCIIETSVGELTELTGLTRQSVAKLRATAGGSGELTEGAGFVFPETGRQGFELILHDYAGLKSKIVWKPAAYVRNGWLKVLDTGPRMAHIPRRVLNIFFQKPRQRVYRITKGELQGRARKRGRKHPPEMVEIDRALDLLARLELLEPLEEGYRILWATFDRPAVAPRTPAPSPDPLTHPAVIAALEKDPERARLALELLKLGRYDLDSHYSAIFRDLRYLRPADVPLLKRKASRHRHRPAEPNKWAYTWKRFQSDLKKRTETVQSETLWLDLELTGRAEGTLAFDAGLDPDGLAWARLVAWADCPEYIAGYAAAHPDEYEITLTLFCGGEQVCRRTIWPDSVTRCSVHHLAMRAPAGTPFTLQAVAAGPLPRIRVKARLEGRANVRMNE